MPADPMKVDVIGKMFRDAILKHVGGGRRPRSFTVAVDHASVAAESHIQIGEQYQILLKAFRETIPSGYVIRHRPATKEPVTIYEIRKAR